MAEPRRPARQVLAELLTSLDEVGGPAGRPDPLDWPGYDALRGAAQERSGTDESVIVGVGDVRGADGAQAVVVAWEFGFLGGSMGQAAGQRIAAAYDLARERRLPIVLAAASGGARMQEGMTSLVQLAATTVAARQHAEAGLLQLAVLRNPTTGGVFASHLNLADVIFAEAGATIGFAGPRVAEALTGGPLPDHSHTARGAVASGLADHLVEIGGAIAAIGALVAWAACVEAGAPPVAPRPLTELVATDDEVVDAWAAVEAARAPHRARAQGWLEALDVTVELRGDRAGGDDPTIRVVLARLHGAPIVVVAMDRDADEARVTPGGYRKAWRGLLLAQRLGIPLVTLVDTAGAQADAESEAGGIAHHIARTFSELVGLSVPTVALITGEGSSGGALALATCDRLLMQEHATFSVIAPEGAAAILHRDARRASKVAALLRSDAHTLADLGIADAVISEVGDRIANGWDAIAACLAELATQDAQERRSTRLARWRSAPSRP